MAPKNIMIIDDDPLNNLINRKLINRVFPDIMVTEDIDANKALEKIRNDYLPDLILLDLNMPGMNGWEFLDHFQKVAKDIKVFILTSSVDPADRKKALKYNCVQKYLVKPLDKNIISTFFN